MYAKYSKYKQTALLREALQLPPVQVPLSKIFVERMQQGYIRRYDKLSYTPYIYKNPVPPTVFNTFTEFHLLHFKKTKNVDYD